MANNAEFLEWLEAADVLRIQDDERRSAGWPCEFDLASIASLQHPDTPKHGAGARREQRQARDRLIEAMKTSIAAGELKAETRRTEIKKAAFHAPQPSAGLGSAAWLSRDFDRQDEQNAARTRRAAQSDVTIVANEIVPREAFAAWGGLPDQKQSELIRAWLRQGVARKSPLKEKRPTKFEQFQYLLTRVEQAWLGSGRGAIDRREWPGTSKDLCNLAGRLLPGSFEGSNPDSFYRNYPKKAGLAFSGSPGAGDIYAELFPAADEAAGLSVAA